MDEWKGKLLGRQMEAGRHADMHTDRWTVEKTGWLVGNHMDRWEDEQESLADGLVSLCKQAGL